MAERQRRRWALSLANELAATPLDAGPFLTVNDGRTLRRVTSKLLRGIYGLPLAGPRVTAAPLQAGDLHIAGQGSAGESVPFQFPLESTGAIDPHCASRSARWTARAASRWSGASPAMTLSWWR